MNLFIDTNIFLTFYHLSNADLEELEKLAYIIESNEIILYLPNQVKDEFYRNRANSIYKSIKHLTEQKISGRYPQIAKASNEFLRLEDAYRQFEKSKNKIIGEIKAAAKNKKLNADVLVERIFEGAKEISASSTIIESAKLRFDVGNPPGKGKSYGDAIIWECLLSDVTDQHELKVITDDGDYESDLFSGEMHEFLYNEWVDRKKSPIVLFKSISDFLKANYPDIELNDEMKKNYLILGLARASSFAESKSKLNQLSKYKEYTIKQVEDILEAALSNNQVYWIAHDWGVFNVLVDIVSEKQDQINPELYAQFIDVFYEEEHNDSVDRNDDGHGLEMPY